MEVSKRPKRILDIKSNGEHYQVETLVSEYELVEAKVLDDEVFYPHQGISLAELQAITDQGGLLGLRDPTGALIAESQILLLPILEHSHLDSDEGYCYGTAVHSSYQGRGFGPVMAKAQEQVAIEAGKTRLSLSVRPENEVSIIMRLRLGFRIVSYEPHYFGPNEETDGRLLMEKNFKNPFTFQEQELAKQIQYHEIRLMLQLDALLHNIKQGTERFAIPIGRGDRSDATGRQMVTVAFKQGYTALGLVRSNLASEATEAPNYLIFARTLSTSGMCQ